MAMLNQAMQQQMPAPEQGPAAPSPVGQAPGVAGPAQPPPPEGNASAPAHPPGEGPALQPGQGLGPGEIEATPPQQQSYEKGMKALEKILYSNRATREPLIQMVQPDDKIGTTARSVITLITQVDKLVNLDESAVFAITEEATQRLIELAEATGAVEFNEQEYQKTLMASWEGIMEFMGGNQAIQDSYDVLAKDFTPEQISQGQQMYEDLRNV